MKSKVLATLNQKGECFEFRYVDLLSEEQIRFIKKLAASQEFSVKEMSETEAKKLMARFDKRMEKKGKRGSNKATR